MKINSNKGMYLETIINNSIKYYEMKLIAIFRKQFVPIQIKSVKENEVIGKLANKCDVDYYGIHLGRFIAIEAKQVKNNYFNLNNLLDHQIIFLRNVINMEGWSFLIVYFQISNNFYLVDFQIFDNHITSNLKKKRIKEDWFLKNSSILDLIYPGRLNIIETIKKLKT